MLEIKCATLNDADAAFDIRREAIRSQCVGAYTAEQMALWTRGKAEDGYSALMDKSFYLGPLSPGVAMARRCWITLKVSRGNWRLKRWCWMRR